MSVFIPEIHLRCLAGYSQPLLINNFRRLAVNTIFCLHAGDLNAV